MTTAETRTAPNHIKLEQIGYAALDIARQFTEDNDPQRRAELQIAISDVIQRFSTTQDPPVAMPDYLLPHQQRVFVEQQELEKKFNALAAFVEGDLFKTLGEVEQSLLLTQVTAMGLYDFTLQARLNAWDMRRKHFTMVSDQQMVNQRDNGVRECIALVNERLQNYVRDHGTTDPETGTVEFSAGGEDYVSELEEIKEMLTKALGGA